MKSPTAAPLAAVGVPGIRQANVRTMDSIWPMVDQMKMLRRPARSIMNQETVAKQA